MKEPLLSLANPLGLAERREIHPLIVILALVIVIVLESCVTDISGFFKDHALRVLSLVLPILLHASHALLIVLLISTICIFMTMLSPSSRSLTRCMIPSAVRAQALVRCQASSQNQNNPLIHHSPSVE